MNIFLLSKKFKNNARYHNDRHLIKMIIEYIQMLCSAHIILDNVSVINGVPLYKLTHRNHPCAIWVRSSSGNYQFLYKLMSALCDEYDYRYGQGTKEHRSCVIYKNILKKEPKNISRKSLTNYCIAVPDQYKVYNKNGTIDVVTTYRSYYIHGKSHIAKWTKRDKPYWIS